MGKENRLAGIFLQEFVKELIINSSSVEIPKPSPENKKEIEKNFEFQEMQPSQFRVKTVPISRVKIPVMPIQNKTISGKIQKPMVTELPNKKIQKDSFPHPKNPIPMAGPAPGAPDIGKLNFLTADPQVMSIECPGPNKNILVNKSGSIQKTSVTLTKEEIKELIETFSRETRIPLVGGTFKAALGNLILTAVTSEFVGDKFIIQKKNPFAAPRF